MRKNADPLLVLFFLSGFSGLIYESVWTHYVKLFLGHAAYAQTLVLVIFVGGLAVGSWLCSRFTERIARPLRWYAIVEGVIGVMALVFHGVFVAATAWGYDTLLPATCGADSTVCVSQWALSALLLAPQSVLLGATFPLMSAAVIRLREATPGEDIATLYFLNSLGAALGVLAASFTLVPSFGLPGTLLTAGLLNLGIAIVAFGLARGLAVEAALPPPAAAAAPVEAASATPDVPPRRLLGLLLATAMLTGLSSFIYEIAWIRMLGLVLGATTHAFELMLASFILGLALGGLWVRRRIDHAADPLRFLGIVQIVMGVAAAVTVPVYFGVFDVMAWMLDALSRTNAGFVLFNLGSAAICLLVMLPATFCAGMTLPLITLPLLRSPTGERAIGLVYAVNTIGAILGVIITVHLLLEWVGVKGAVLVGAAIDVVLGIVLLAVRGRRAASRPARRWPAAAALATLAAIALFVDLDPRRTASGVFRSGSARLAPNDKVLFHRDGKTATVDVIDHGYVRAIRTNGKSDAAISTTGAANFDEYTMSLLALLPLGHRPDARTAAVIGFGSGMSTATLLGSDRLERVDTIEIEPAMVEGARLFGKLVEPAYNDKRSRIVIDDAKSYFARTGQKYDIIVSEPSNPWISGVASLFTEEFYVRLHAQLAEGGVLAQWIHTYDMDTQTLASIFGAMSRTFPDFVVYTAESDLILIARRGGPPGTFQEAAMRYPAMQPMLEWLRLSDAADIRRRAMGSWSTLGSYFGPMGVPPNSDYFPLVEHRASRSRFTRDRVADLAELRRARVPLMEMLDPAAEAPPRERRSPPLSDWDRRVVWAVHDIMARGAAEGPGFDSPLETSARIASVWARQCDSGVSFAHALPQLLRLAHEVSPQLHPADAGTAWGAIAEGPCARRLSAEERTWLDLFAASGARDAKAMSTLGQAILEADRNARSPATEFAFVAAVTGLLCLGDDARATALLTEGTRSWLRPGQARTELAYLYGLSVNPKRPKCSVA